MAKFDKELIFLYSENARAKLRDLASVLRKSPQRLKYSLSILEKEEVVYDPHCIFDYSYFGLILFRVYFKGGYISEKDKSEIIKRLSENPYIVSIYELSGEFDLVIEIESPNPSRFNKELRKVASLVPRLNKYRIILNLVTHVYPRLYLTKSDNLTDKIPREIIIGGDREREDFSENEMSVMKHILNNPRTRLTSLAKKAELSVKTAKAIIKSLYNRKIIRGFKFIVDHNKLDVHKYRLFLKIHNISKERELQLTEYMLKTKEIVQLNRTAGDWDMEVDIETTKREVIRQLIMQIRENFKDLIEDFNIIEFYRYYKKSYLPEYLFREEEV